MKKVILIIAIVVVVLGLGVFLFSQDAKHPENSDPWASKTTHELALECLDREYTAEHIHPHLVITINGTNQEVPANIGIQGVSGDVSHSQAMAQASCLHPIHTHDNTGTIHVESPVQRDYTLGDFFAVWQQPFSKDQILSYKADADHVITMTVNGQANSQYENLLLKDQDQIVINYGKK